MKVYGRRVKYGAEGLRVVDVGNGDDFSFKVPVTSQSHSQSILKAQSVMKPLCLYVGVTTPSLLN